MGGIRVGHLRPLLVLYASVSRDMRSPQHSAVPYSLPTKNNESDK